jgi:hypothetical protein
LRSFGNIALAGGELDSAADLLARTLTASVESTSSVRIASCLDGVALVAVARERIIEAVRLVAAAARFREDAQHETPPANRRRLDATIGQARAVLGDDAFGAAWADGRASLWTTQSFWRMREAHREMETLRNSPPCSSRIQAPPAGRRLDFDVVSSARRRAAALFARGVGVDERPRIASRGWRYGGQQVTCTNERGC